VVNVKAAASSARPTLRSLKEALAENCARSNLKAALLAQSRSLIAALAHSCARSQLRSLTAALAHSCARSWLRSLMAALAHGCARSWLRSLMVGLAHGCARSCGRARSWLDPPSLGTCHCSGLANAWDHYAVGTTEDAIAHAWLRARPASSSHASRDAHMHMHERLSQHSTHILCPYLARAN
jgi:hypothetical protein